LIPSGKIYVIRLFHSIAFMQSVLFYSVLAWLCLLADTLAHAGVKSTDVSSGSLQGQVTHKPVSIAASSNSGNGVHVQSDEAAINKIPLRLPLVQPEIVVFKSRRRLMLFSNGKVVRTYRVGLGQNPVEDKVKEGDLRTPEGQFYIFTKNEKSTYYLSLGLSYPNIEDAKRGLRDGLIDQKQHDRIVNAIHRKTTPPQNTALGGQIYIHGKGSQSDWTLGCIALDDGDMQELFNAVPPGTTVVVHR
jgi:lipoprotein-anchoring transpeptidase ErfK/SrfK